MPQLRFPGLSVLLESERHRECVLLAPLFRRIWTIEDSMSTTAGHPRLKRPVERTKKTAPATTALATLFDPRRTGEPQ
jgi:hypothetical protein